MAKPKEDRLAQEALAATKANMSYGNWKAQQSAPKPTEKQPPKRKKATAGPRPLCRICGKAIPELTRRRTYCSPECADTAAREKYRI